jgi:hypothetical protein
VKGQAQNAAEGDWSIQNYNIVAKTFDREDEDWFLEMELAQKVTKSIFKKILGFSIENPRSTLSGSASAGVVSIPGGPTSLPSKPASSRKMSGCRSWSRSPSTTGTLSPET